MQTRTIYITEKDMNQLKRFLSGVDKAGSLDRKHLLELEAELARAKVVPPAEVPPDVVTMNSKVRILDLDTKETATYSLVYPADADIDQHRISVLAPVGTALLGFRAGDVIEWKVPLGMRKLKIEEVLFQPEAASQSQA
jgi:regulator of nucleoside diphosphate kinase